LIILGSTGSIGVNTLKIAKRYNLNVEVLVAGRNIELLNQQIKQFNPTTVIISSKSDIHKVNHNNVFAGQNAILDVIKSSKSKIVVNALVGFFGLAPTIEAIKQNKKVALANKESLVVAGQFLDISKIHPIDSEHFALWYLQDSSKTISSMTIMASGGSFRDIEIDKLKNVTVQEALNHPNWSMGNKITIDSATMTNKIFELIEAKWLFNTNKIDAIIEPKSIIHAMINFIDGSSTAHIANTSMQLPIAYALLGKVDKPILEPINLLQIQSLEFRQIDPKRYPIWDIKQDMLNNPNLGVILNSANDFAVEQFLNGKIGFLDITNITLNAINKFHNIKITSTDDIFQINKEVLLSIKDFI